MTLDEIAVLAREICDGTIPDERPDWLRAMPGAVHPGEPYYHFFYEYAKRAKPSSFIEIGTRGGTTAIHVAFGYPQCAVTTVDIVQGCKPNVETIAAKHSLNVVGVTGDSQKVSAQTPDGVDMLFVDGHHNLAASYSDYLLYRNRVRHGGMIFFDDTKLSHEMILAWRAIADPKIELPDLHYMGFGICQKDRNVTPPSLGQIR